MTIRIFGLRYIYYCRAFCEQVLEVLCTKQEVQYDHLSSAGQSSQPPGIKRRARWLHVRSALFWFVLLAPCQEHCTKKKEQRIVTDCFGQSLDSARSHTSVACQKVSPIAKD